MSIDRLRSCPRLPDSRAETRTQGYAVRWGQVGLLALVAVGLAAGVVSAAGDPDWFGSQPRDISLSPLVRAWQPAIAAGSSGLVVAAWSDIRTEGQPRDIYVAFSSNGGWAWSTPQAISMTTGQSLLPDALVVEDRTWITWRDELAGPTFTIYEAERDAGSGAWTTRAVPGSTSDASTRPRLAVSPGRLHLAFHAGPEATPSILYAARWFTETSWPNAVVVVTPTANTGLEYPAIAIDPGGATVHLVWVERVLLTKTYAIQYMSGTLTGDQVNWSGLHTELSAGIDDSRWPDIAADSRGNVHVVWGEYVDAGENQTDQYVRYARYDAAGGSWLPPTRIDPQPVRVNEAIPYDAIPRLALHEESEQVTLCATWYGFRAGGAAEEVLLSCSQDGGASWSSPENVSRTPETDAMSILPALDIDASGNVHVAWQERQGASAVDDYQVYYARSPGQAFLPVAARLWRDLPHKRYAPLILRTWQPVSNGAFLRLVMRND